MPTTYRFLTFSHVNGMRDATAKKQIRQHAMKDIGASRRRYRGRKFPLELDPKATQSCQDETPLSGDHLPLGGTSALYDSYVRAMSCKTDPFGTASVHIDATINGLLQYFIYYSSNFPSNFTFTPRIHDLVDSALQDDLLIHCILSAAASRVRYVEDLDLAPFKERELLSTQQSIKLLQHNLRDVGVLPRTSKERLVNCMLYLGAGAIYRQEWPTARLHINAAIELPELLGTVTNLQDPQMLVRAISLDDLLSCSQLRSCRVKPTYDPGRLSLPGLNTNFRRKHLDTLPCGFTTSDPEFPPPSMKSLIQQVVECCRIKCCVVAPDQMPSSQAFTQSQKLKLRILATRNRLLAYSNNDNGTEVLRLTLILCTLLPPGDLRQVRMAQGVAQRLRDKLARSFHTAWKGAEGIRLWCLLIGRFCARPSEATRKWFDVKICNIIRLEGSMLGIQAGPRLLADLIAFQEQFVFEDLVLKPFTENLARHGLEQLLCLI
jgi:hypothetical protein